MNYPFFELFNYKLDQLAKPGLALIIKYDSFTSF